MVNANKVIMNIVCFYYKFLTPGAGSCDSPQDRALEAIFVGFLQGFIASYLFASFEWVSHVVFWADKTGFLESLLTVGLPIGLWTLIGGLAYPALEEIDRGEAKEKSKKNIKRIVDASFSQFFEVDEEREEELKKYHEIVKKNPREATRMLSKYNSLIMKGKEEEIDLKILRNTHFNSQEIQRISDLF